MKKWSTLRKLLLLQLLMGGGTPTETLTVSGISPLSLANAISHTILSLTQTGKCSQASTPTPTSPVDIYCNNGALKMLNLANMTADNIVVGKYINNNGAEANAPSNFYYSPLVPVKASTAYTLKTSRSLNYSNIMEYGADKGFLKRTLYGSADTPAGETTTHTTRADTAYIRFGSNINGGTLTADAILAIDWMLTEGATATDYVPYGQLSIVGTPEVITLTHADSTTETATAENLFAVGDYADTQDIISGLVTRKIGIKVFDGKESFGKSSAYGAAFYIQSAAGAWGAKKEIVMCSHYLGLSPASSVVAEGTCFFNASGHFYFRVSDNSDTAAFKVWLAEQYAAGTPVILLYSRTTETTEQVTPQSLSTDAGNNALSWTAEVSGKTMSATYVENNSGTSNKVGTGKVGYMKI